MMPMRITSPEIWAWALVPTAAPSSSEQAVAIHSVADGARDGGAIHLIPQQDVLGALTQQVFGGREVFFVFHQEHDGDSGRRFLAAAESILTLRVGQVQVEQDYVQAFDGEQGLGFVPG